MYVNDVAIKPTPKQDGYTLWVNGNVNKGYFFAKSYSNSMDAALKAAMEKSCLYAKERVEPMYNKITMPDGTIIDPTWRPRLS